MIFLAIICILAIVIVVYMRYQRTASLKMEAILQPYIRDEVKEIIIPDGIGGLLEVEHLILLDQGLLLIETYPMSGNLFGAETIDQWSQIVDGRSYKFPNPLRRIRTSRQAIKAINPKVKIPVFCRIIFNANSVFPKGKPDEVSVLASLEADMIVLKNEPMINEQAQQAWNTIMRIGRKNGQAINRDEQS